MHLFYVGDHPFCLDASSSPYLSSSITPDNDIMEEFNMRIGWERSVSFKLLWNQEVTKSRVFNAAVMSTLQYSAGTWTRKEQQTKQLESAQYRLVHYMLGAKPMDWPIDMGI